MTFYAIYQIVWALVAIAVGGFAFFATSKFNEGNAKGFEKLSARTGFSLFKGMAESTRGDMQYLITKIVGLGGLITGILLLFGFIELG